jgi:HK97 family phage major capsid protein
MGMTIQLPDLTNVRDGYYRDTNDRAADAKALRAQVWDSMRTFMADAEAKGRDLLADERRSYDKAEKLLDELQVIYDESYVDRRGVVAPDPRAVPQYREGHPLTRGQTFAGFARARGHELGEPERDRDNGADLSLSKCLRGAMTGDWRDAEAERRAMSGATGGAGGFQLPTMLAAQVIDLARGQTRVLEAGATVIPMDSRTVDVAKWVTDPTPAWRAENAAIAESDGALDKVTLAAKSLAVVTRVSRELVEDTDVDDQLKAAFASAFALQVDAAALYGAGVNNQPTGVKVNAGVTKTPLAVNGAAPTWDALLDSVGRLRDQNETPTAQILADRSARSLAKLKDSSGAYLAPPTYLADVPRLVTSQVGVANTVGTSTDASDVFTADWTQLYIGVRIALTITLLEERYMPDAGQFGFVGWWRGDIQVARPKAFDVVTGVRP